MMEHFKKKVNGFQPLIFFWKTLRHKCLTIACLTKFCWTAVLCFQYISQVSTMFCIWLNKLNGDIYHFLFLRRSVKKDFWFVKCILVMWLDFIEIILNFIPRLELEISGKLEKSGEVNWLTVLNTSQTRLDGSTLSLVCRFSVILCLYSFLYLLLFYISCLAVPRPALG